MIGTALTYDQALALARSKGEELVPTWCGMCGPAPNCAVYAFRRDGVFTNVAGMLEAPQNKGRLCAKAYAAPQFVYSAERIRYPMLRTGKRGEGKFKRVSWDEAISFTAQKLLAQKAEFGAESLAILSPARRDYSAYLSRFLAVHGSPHYAHSGICAMQILFSFTYTLGGRAAPDYKNADVILIWGKQPVYSGPSLGSGLNLVDAKARGAKIYAIKPSLEADGSHASVWVPVRPGTDAALALAMLHVICAEGLVDHDFIANWCHGYAELKEHVKAFSPGWAADICGVAPDIITEMARTYATTPKAAIDFGNGLEHAPSASDALRAIAILIAITGHLERSGCNLMQAPPSVMPPTRELIPWERYSQKMLDAMVKPEFPKVFQPFNEGFSCAYCRVFENILEDNPTIHAVIAPGTQPLVSTRDPRQTLAALEKVGLFVVADTTRTAEMPWADVVFPILTTYEAAEQFLIRGSLIMARRPVIKPLAEGKSMQELLMDLGVAMGYADDFWQGDLARCMNWQLEPLSLDMAQLLQQPCGINYAAKARELANYAKLFTRKSKAFDGHQFLEQGKVAIYNTRFEKAGFSALPDWVAPAEGPAATPELQAEFPFIFSDYHTSRSFSASWQRHVPLLRSIEPEPELHIHPQSAAALGIADGDKVKVSSPHGFICVRAKLYPGIRPDTVMLLHGWWQGCSELGKTDYPLFDGGANANLLYPNTPDTCYDPLVTAMSSQTLVRVEKLDN